MSISPSTTRASTCVNGQTPVASNPTGSSVSFALVDGADVVCTITNSLRPVLTVKKVVVGDAESTFDLFVKDGQQFNTKVINDGGNGATDTRTYSPVPTRSRRRRPMARRRSTPPCGT